MNVIGLFRRLGTLIFCEIELPTQFPDPQYQRYDLVLNRHAHNLIG